MGRWALHHPAVGSRLTPCAPAAFPSSGSQESWVEQFDEGAREFARAFAATQHFSAYSDERLRGLELRDASSVGVLFDIKL